MNTSKEPQLVLRLPPLDAPTASWIIDLCGHLQREIWLRYGDELEAYWTATNPTQPIYGSLQTPRRRTKRR
jgi:hypothetical protein